jgi:hypothetical protein
MNFAILCGSQLIGCVLIYAAIFIKRSEEGRFQNRLESWLIIIQRQRAAALSYTLVILNAIAQKISAAFDRVFGKRLFSLQSFLVSMCLSMSSMSLVFGYGNIWELKVISGTGCILFLILGLVPTFVTDKIKRTFWAVVVLLLAAFVDVVLSCSACYSWEALGLLQQESSTLARQCLFCCESRRSPICKFLL